jgi:plasmid stabilization system protein ParE
MDFKIIWTDSAIADLRDICEYISRDNPSAAEKIGRGILDHVKILETFPFIGPAYPGAPVAQFVKSSIASIGFSMKSQTSPRGSASSASGTGCETSRSFVDLN